MDGSDENVGDGEFDVTWEDEQEPFLEGVLYWLQFLTYGWFCWSLRRDLRRLAKSQL